MERLDFTLKEVNAIFLKENSLYYQISMDVLIVIFCDFPDSNSPIYSRMITLMMSLFNKVRGTNLNDRMKTYVFLQENKNKRFISKTIDTTNQDTSVYDYFNLQMKTH